MLMICIEARRVIYVDRSIFPDLPAPCDLAHQPGEIVVRRLGVHMEATRTAELTESPLADLRVNHFHRHDQHGHAEFDCRVVDDVQGKGTFAHARPSSDHRERSGGKGSNT